MKLLIAILRQNISVVQIISFVLANLVGGFIVLMGIQVYRDADSFMEAGDNVLRSEQIVITKPVGVLSSVTSIVGLDTGFSDTEIEDISHLPNVDDVGTFVPASCRVRGQITLGEVGLSTDMFLESVPDKFVDVTMGDHEWDASVESSSVPVIIPRTYLNLYNFGFASTRGLPQMGEGMIQRIPFRLMLQGNGRSRMYDARIVGFSSKLNTILVPKRFVSEVNDYFSDGVLGRPSRLIVSTLPGREPSELLDYIARRGYIIEGDSDGVKLQALVHGVLSVVIVVGLIVSFLAFYLLVISIHLLIEKNRTKLQTLSALGYSSAAVARPYLYFVSAIDVVVWMLSALVVWAASPQVSELLEAMSSEFVASSRSIVFMFALAFAVLFVTLHFWIIMREIAMSKCRT